jgi:hypothetical protein
MSVRALDIAGANAAGKISHAIPVRLAAAQGISNAKALRLYFMPLKKIMPGPPTRLNLQVVTLADLVEAEKIYLPTEKK